MKEMTAEIDKAAVISALQGNHYNCTRLEREYKAASGKMERETIVVDGRGTGTRVKLTIRREEIEATADETPAK